MSKVLRYGAIGFVVLLVLSPEMAWAQVVDPTSIVTSVLAWLTGPFGKAAVGLAVAGVGFACILGHHPMAGLGVLLLGAFLIFGGQFFVTQFVGG